MWILWWREAQAIASLGDVGQQQQQQRACVTERMMSSWKINAHFKEPIGMPTMYVQHTSLSLAVLLGPSFKMILYRKLSIVE